MGDAVKRNIIPFSVILTIRKGKKMKKMIQKGKNKQKEKTRIRKGKKKDPKKKKEKKEKKGSE